MNNQIDRAFGNYEVLEVKAELAELRKAAKLLAYKFDELCPAGREKSLAMTKLEESIMWATAAVQRDVTQAEMDKLK